MTDKHQMSWEDVKRDASKWVTWLMVIAIVVVFIAAWDQPTVQRTVGPVLGLGVGFAQMVYTLVSDHWRLLFIVIGIVVVGNKLESIWLTLERIDQNVQAATSELKQLSDMVAETLDDMSQTPEERQRRKDRRDEVSRMMDGWDEERRAEARENS
jgi:hypothetical protein